MHNIAGTHRMQAQNQLVKYSVYNYYYYYYVYSMR